MFWITSKFNSFLVRIYLFPKFHENPPTTSNLLCSQTTKKWGENTYCAQKHEQQKPLSRDYVRVLQSVKAVLREEGV